jgi:acetyl esterase/lipase
MGALGQACHKHSIRLAEPYLGQGQHHAYGSDAFQGLIVHPAAQPTGAVLLFFHGGGWTHGYKEWMSMMAGALNQRGITLVTAGYRLAPENLFPAGLKDCEAALNWVADRHDDFGGASDRMFVGGHSAGGHYASLLAVGARTQGQPAIAGCLPISGVYQFGPGSGLNTRPRFLGPENVNMDRQASPLLADLKGAPPFFISYGERDFPHLKEQALRMADALRAATVPVDVVELQDCDHLQASYAAAELDGRWIDHADAFMRCTQADGLKRKGPVHG